MSKGRVFAMKPLTFMRVKAEGNQEKGSKKGKVPKARSGHRIVSDADGNVYSFGGYNPQVDINDEDLQGTDWTETHPLFRELWKFNMSTRTWIKLETTGEAPTQLASHCATIVNNRLVVYGGTGVPFGHNSSNQIYTCNLNTLEWQLIRATDSPLNPMEQYGQAIVVDNEEGCLYVVGGTTGYRYSIDVHRFSFRTKTWTELWRKVWGRDTTPEERYRHEIVFYRNHIYVFGGGTAETCFGFKEIPVFSLESRSWESVQTKSDLNSEKLHPDARRCHGCVNIDEDVFIVGGTSGPSVCNDLWKLNLETMQWTEMAEKMPVPVYFHSASISPYGQMTIFGGVTSTSHTSRTNELYTVWLKTPSLKELAWMSILYYSGRNRLARIPSSELASMGIPESFIRRLNGPELAQPY